MPSARHLRSAGKWVLITVYSRRGIEAMDAAGALPAFAGIACLDAWAPCDTSGTWPGTLRAMLTSCAS